MLSVTVRGVGRSYHRQSEYNTTTTAVSIGTKYSLLIAARFFSHILPWLSCSSVACFPRRSITYLWYHFLSIII